MVRQHPIGSDRYPRLRDERGRRVVFLSHCLLNENTRYLGGAARPGCVREIVDACVDAGLGMVQLPCPEEHAWGGVHKRWLLRLYGSARWLPRPLRRVMLPAVLTYTRWVYVRLARDAARQVADYRRAGYEIVTVVGVNGSPSCGVHRSLDIPAALDRLAEIDRAAITSAAMNAILRDAGAPGAGLFTEQLHRQLRARRINMSFLAHDLQRELAGDPSPAATALRDLGPQQ